MSMVMRMGIMDFLGAGTFVHLSVTLTSTYVVFMDVTLKTHRPVSQGQDNVAP